MRPDSRYKRLIDSETGQLPRSKTPLELAIDATTDKQARYRKKRADLGVVQVSVWVPATAKEAVRAFAETCRTAGGPPSGNTGGIKPPSKRQKPEQK